MERKEESRTGRARLTKRQMEILDYICITMRTRGFSPSIREIGEAVGLSSSSTVHSHLRSLEQKDYIRRNPSKPRSIEVVNGLNRPVSKMIEVPVRPWNEASSEPTLSLPMDLVGNASSFLYRINSERFAQEAIMPGDLLIVNPAPPITEGDMVLSCSKATDAVSANAQDVQVNKYDEMDEAPRQVMGRVVGVIRQMPVKK